jgi:hypothetical protein
MPSPPPIEAASDTAAAQTESPNGDPEVGVVDTPGYASGHRLFVDGRVVGGAGQPVRTRCGVHVVKVGSAGRPQVVDIPCGGWVHVDVKW